MRLILSFLLTLTLADAASAAMACQYVHSRQSSVELEIGNAPMVMELFTTLDGTIAPVLAPIGIAALEPSISKMLHESFPGEDVSKLSWDLLSHGEKTKVLMFAAKARHQEFFKNRVIHGLKYNRTVTLKFAEPTEFLGQVYPQGLHQFESRDIFSKTQIEYMGPNRMTENLGFELHVRSSRPSNQNYQTARALSKALVGVPQALHLHIVAPISPDANVRLSWTEIFRRIEFHRRTSLLFEMKMIARGLGMKRIATEFADGRESGASNFSDFSPGQAMGGAQQYFRFYNWDLTANSYEKAAKMLGLGGVPDKIDLFSKTGTVGIRGSSAYDSVTVPLWGVEVRYLSASHGGQQDAQDLRSVQKKMVHFDYTMSPDEAKAYGQSQEKKNLSFEEIVENLWYVKGEVSDQRGVKLEALLSERSPIWQTLTEAQRKLVKEKFEANSFLFMLTHDWSRDPMFIGQPEKIQQIKNAQKVALTWILGNGQGAEVMRYFIKRSGLEYAIRSSYGTYGE